MKVLCPVVVLGSFALAACSASAPTCQDDDLDERGKHCDRGPDCDDTNPLRINNCDTVPEPDCVLEPDATGCPCAGTVFRDCYSGPDGTVDVGVCVPGHVTCVHGHWGLCDGQAVPGPEVCDDSDQDCDGTVDEGVRSPCGGCNRSCVGGVWGDITDPFSEDDGEDVAVDELGELVLSKVAPPAEDWVWVPSTLDGTVSRIDAEVVSERARYESGDAPSRVAVDYRGDAWIANRAVGEQSSVIKIAGDYDDCVDANMDGLMTSAAGDDVLPLGADDCVLLRADVGSPGEDARALAIDGTLDDAHGGNVWVGFYEGQRFAVLDGADAEELNSVEVPGFRPYSAAFDPWGTLWALDRNGILARILPTSGEPEVELIEVPFACYLTEALAVDALGRVFLTSPSCDAVFRYEPWSGAFKKLGVPEAPRGVTTLGTDVWVTHAAGFVSQIAGSTFLLQDTYDLRVGEDVPFDTSGIAADGFGALWTVSGNTGGSATLGLATRFDREETEPTDVLPLGKGPEVLGDMTGASRPGGFVPEGSARHVFEGCGGSTQWKRLHVDADLPGSAALTLRARHAATADALDGATFEVVAMIPDDESPFALDLPKGGVVEVEVTLNTASRDGSPRLRRVGLEWECEGPL